MMSAELELIGELAVQLETLQRKYLEAREAIIFEILGKNLEKCKQCDRMLLPRRIWDRTPLFIREMIRLHIVKAGAEDLCSVCVVWWRKGKQMDKEKLIQLRHQVGLIA
jgi:hypothetical protein